MQKEKATSPEKKAALEAIRDEFKGTAMRQRTYDRLWESLMDCETRRDEAFALVVQRFMGKF